MTKWSDTMRGPMMPASYYDPPENNEGPACPICFKLTENTSHDCDGDCRRGCKITGTPEPCDACKNRPWCAVCDQQADELNGDDTCEDCATRMAQEVLL